MRRPFDYVVIVLDRNMGDQLATSATAPTGLVERRQVLAADRLPC